MSVHTKDHNNTDKVSIVLPVYNGSRFLCQSIESVLNQTYKNLELIIVNDASTDNSLQIAENYAKKDERVKVIDNAVNKKLPESLNIGFEFASGVFYTWTSDDNWYEPTAIEEMVSYLKDHEDIKMVCSDMTLINDSLGTSSVFIVDPKPQTLVENNKCGACFMWSADTAHKVGKYDASYFLAEDYEYWLRIGLLGPISRLEKNLYNYRIHATSLTSTKQKEVLIVAKRIKKKYRPLYQKLYPNLFKQNMSPLIMEENINVSDSLALNLNEILDSGCETKNIASESNIFLRRLLKSNSMPDRIFRKGNIQFYLPNYPRDKSQTSIVDSNNFNEAYILQRLDAFLKDDAVIVDVGAFIGNHTLYWAIERNAKKIYAYEPLHESYKILKRNVKNNDLKDVVEVRNLALGNCEGVVKVENYSTLDMGNTTFKPIDDNKKHNGKLSFISTLDSQVLSENKVDLLKIDTSGSEEQVLLGASGFIKKYQPNLILIECSLGDEYLRKCKSILESYDYKILSDLPGYRAIFVSSSFSDGVKIDKTPLDHFNAAKKWIENNTIDSHGITVTSNNRIIYPEVTGYYIPTLLKYGDKARAKAFGDYLVSIQNDDGSWSDPSGSSPYTFDTGMILKGLIDLIKHDMDQGKAYKSAIIKGADWILTQQQSDGSISTPDKSCWGLPFDNQVPEAIHVYCLSALRDAATLFNKSEYTACVDKALKFYLADKELTTLNTLSHFNAYIIEGLIDLGEIDRAKEAMNKIRCFQNDDGSIRAYNNVDFVCSTGMFQYAICWFKLGEIASGQKTFEYAVKLQNQSGGWCGSYGDECNYFPEDEISWAVKYYLDAIYFMRTESYKMSNEALDSIDESDGRFVAFKKAIAEYQPKTFLDLGCGKARYTRQVLAEFPNTKFYGVDLNDNLMATLPEAIVQKSGSILDIPYKENYFDFVFLSESLEHAIDIDSALDEIKRVLKPNGVLLVIDKDSVSENAYMMADFEQWFGQNSFMTQLENHGFTPSVKTDLTGNTTPGFIFNAWFGKKI